MDDENIDLYVSLEGNAETADDTSKEEKKTRKHGLLNWLKLRVCILRIAILYMICISLYPLAVNNFLSKERQS